MSKGGVVVLVIVIVLAIYVLGRQSERESAPPGGSAPMAPTGQAAAPRENPIERQLRPRDGVERKDGIGVVLLVDVSGSMDMPVPDAQGGQSRKIVIARRCALNVLRQCDAFIRANSNRVVVVGVYEFSDLGRQRPFCRVVVPIGPLDLQAAGRAVGQMAANGGTPIGDAIITAKKDLDATGLTRLHVLVVTDGENNVGYDPADVVNAVSLLPAENRASVYFIAFDVAAEKFARVRDSGGLVLPAGNEKELQQTLDYVLSGKILAEQPAVPGANK